MNITRGAIAIMLLIAMSLPCSGQRLFHISRSVNRNWVCYDVNLKGGALDKANPIHVFWHNNTDRPGHENELSLIQRKLAYGYKIISVGNNEATVRLTAYKKRDIRVCRNNGRWIAQVDINGKPARLTEIQVKTKEGNPLNVLYINLVGVTLKGGANVVERILNKYSPAGSTHVFPQLRIRISAAPYTSLHSSTATSSWEHLLLVADRGWVASLSPSC